LGIDTTLTGDGPGGEMILTLNGEISSNRERGVPSPIVEKERNKLVVRLYPNQPSFFVLSQSGSAIFEARLPQSFQGKIKAVGSSDSIMVSRFDLKEMDINSSSGSVTATDIKAESASFEVSSGKFAGDEIRSSGRLDIESSSGALDIGRIEGTEVTIEASSGGIRLDEVEASAELSIKASSGHIRAGRLSAPDIELDTSSGGISVDALSGSLSLDSSSGGADIGFEDLRGPVKMDVSSGNITLVLPENAAFDVRLKTSSGRIRSDFPVLGDLSNQDEEMRGSVNGGGVLVDLKASSGNISLEVR
jgi:DUF4097 and DUF4098 domain-containing protein YvlB